MYLMSMSPNSRLCSTRTMERLYSSSTAKNVTTTSGVGASLAINCEQRLLVLDALVDGAHVHLHRDGLRSDVLAFQQKYLAPRQRTSGKQRKRVKRHVAQEVRHEV